MPPRGQQGPAQVWQRVEKICQGLTNFFIDQQAVQQSAGGVTGYQSIVFKSPIAFIVDASNARRC